MATATYKCPNCGGGLKFEPAIQKLKCEFCLSEFTSEEVQKATIVMESRADQEKTHDDAHLKGYTCDSCGAEVVTEETTSATFCYYCHNPVILSDRLTGTFRPDKVIPFAYSRDKAEKTFLSWAKSKRYVPREFYSSSQLEKISGVYIPYWSAEAEARVDYSGKGTNRRVYRAGNTEYTEVKEFGIERHGKVDVQNIREVALKKIDKGLLDSISPYDDRKAVDFEPSYLSGFLAEKYDIEKESIQPTVQERAERYAESLVQESISGFGSVQLHQKELDVSIKDWDYTLLPAWILTYFYGGRTYIFAVNGQTGKSYGELPVDNKKLGLSSAVIGFGILALALLGGALIW